MALVGDAIRIIDPSHPMFEARGATGRIIHGEFHGRYIAEIDGVPPQVPAVAEVAEGQFVVLPKLGENGRACA